MPTTNRPDADARTNENQRPQSRGELLILEDDDNMRTLLEHLLRDEGYRVASATSPLEALEIVESLGQHDSPLYALDLIIADWWMPEMTGGEFLEWLRDADEQTPVIVISGYLTDETAREALRRDASAVMSKPFALTDLLATIDSHLG